MSLRRCLFSVAKSSIEKRGGVVKGEHAAQVGNANQQATVDSMLRMLISWK